MYCKLCNTRIGEGERVCPNCGKLAPSPPIHPRTAPEPAPAPRAPEALGDEPDELEVSLEEALQEATPPPEPAAARERPQPGAPPSAGDRPLQRGSEAAPRAARSGGAPAPILGLEPETLRELVASDPSLVEPELSALGDGEGSPMGAGYATPVGAIDLLGRDRRGNLVVVQVAERGAGAAALSEALERVGWVRKHLAQPGQGVRAVVLLERPSPELGYAAAAVAETVAFKTWRVRLHVEDLAL